MPAQKSVNIVMTTHKQTTWTSFMLSVAGIAIFSVLYFWELEALSFSRAMSVSFGLFTFFIVSGFIAIKTGIYKRIWRSSEIDSLTGLGSRVAFIKELGTLITRSKKQEQRFHVLLVNIRNFKEINDALGYEIGDDFLRQFAKKIRNSAGDDTFIARLNGNEFAILNIDNKKNNSYDDIIKKLHKSIVAPLSSGGKKLYLNTSIGVSTYPDNGITSVDLLRCSDIAMRNAKKIRKGYCVYKSEEVYGIAGGSLIGEIRTAIDNKEFALWVQPKKNLLTNKVESVECLLRWNHPLHGILSPDTFIPGAEAGGIIEYITHYVIKEAVIIYNKLKDAGYDLQISINVSANDILDPDIVPTIIKNIVSADMETKKLVLEVTETAIIHELESAIKVLVSLDALGIRISVDDFGTGFSSLIYLKKYPICEIKFDKSFIMDIESSKESFNIVKSSIKMAHALGATTVAEGVETAQVENTLRDLQCDYIQGYFLARPMTVENFIVWMGNNDKL